MRAKKERVKPEEIVMRFLSDPLQVELMTQLSIATDEELKAYGAAVEGLLTVLVRWAKKAAFGLEGVETLRTWFCHDGVPVRVQELLMRLTGLMGA